MLEFFKAAFLVLLYINNITDNVICNIAIYADVTNLYSKSDQASDLWQQLELTSELEPDLWDTLDWGRKWLVGFNAGKIQLALFDQSNNGGAMLMILLSTPSVIKHLICVSN